MTPWKHWKGWVTNTSNLMLMKLTFSSIISVQFVKYFKLETQFG